MDSNINIEEEVIKVIERDFAVRRDVINKNTTLEDLKIDKLSTDYVDLLSGLENKFDIIIQEDDFLNVVNIEDIINLVDKYLTIKNQNNTNNDDNNEENNDDIEDNDDNIEEIEENGE